MRTIRLLVLVSIAVLVTASPAVTSVPMIINYQGKLMQPNGAPVPDGEYRMTFAIYGQETGGTALWSEPNEHVQVKGGLYSVLLGSVLDLPANTFDLKPDEARYFGVRVGDDNEITPRQQIASVAFAIHAGSAATARSVDDAAIITQKLADRAVTTAKLGDSCVTGLQIADLAISGSKLTVGAITADKLAPNSVLTAAIADRQVTASKIADGAITQVQAPFALAGPADSCRVQAARGVTEGANPITVTFPTPFQHLISVSVQPEFNTTAAVICTVNPNYAGFQAWFRDVNGDPITMNQGFHWIAIGY